MNESLFVKKAMEFSKHYHGPFIKKIHVFDDLASTNSALRSLAIQGVEEGTVVIAHMQSKGRGRFDRVWQSPKGGVYLSLLLRPKAPVEKTSLLAFVVALAVTQTVRSYSVPAHIKWPNDVLVNGKKIAGILLESETSGTSVVRYRRHRGESEYKPCTIIGGRSSALDVATQRTWLHDRILRVSEHLISAV